MSILYTVPITTKGANMRKLLIKADMETIRPNETGNTMTGSEIKKWREDHLIEQAALAERMGIRGATLSRIENGKVVPHFSTTRKMFAAMLEIENEQAQAEKKRKRKTRRA